MSNLKTFLDEANNNLIGKEDKFILVLTNLLAGGNTLLEDVPGVGKTTMVKFIAEVFDMKLSRIQFTNDLLPSDILGVPIYSDQSKNFEFHPGPIFGDIIMADELNRAPPKTQSALLQAMEEKNITIDNKTYQLPPMFHVMATQNPHSQVGTYDLPESQLDRFSMKLAIGYPDKESTLLMLKEKSLDSEVKIKNKIDQKWILDSRDKISSIFVSDAIFEYVYKLLDHSRSSDNIALSNRAGIDLVRIAKAFSFLKNESSVLPEHIQEVFPYVIGHRLVNPSESNIHLEHQLANKIIKAIDIRL